MPVSLTDVIFFGCRAYTYNQSSRVFANILIPHLNYFLFSVNSCKSDYWSLQVAKGDIITNISWGFSNPERPPLCIPIVISLRFS